MISRHYDSRWTKGKEEFWEEVVRALPAEFQDRAKILRESIDKPPADREAYDRDLIYHRRPEEVARALQAGGYHDLGSAPHANGNVFDFLKELNGLESFIDESDHEMSN